MSLWDGETNLFLDESDPRGLGLSETAYNFIGGLKAHARATSALTAPTVNSYKRLKVGTTTSGATWSPVWISYGYNNRTQMLRIPGRGASRIARSTARATRTSRLRRSLLRAGRDRVGLDAGEPNSENLCAIPFDELRARGLETLPTNLLMATIELAQDEVLRAALGAGRGLRRLLHPGSTSGTATTSRSRPGRSASTSHGSEHYVPSSMCKASDWPSPV